MITLVQLSIIEEKMPTEKKKKENLSDLKDLLRNTKEELIV